MKLNRQPISGIPRAGNRRRAGTSRSNAGFTLAEVLAALVFMAIVIPAAIEGLHVASLAGEVAVRKAAAVRVGDRVLNESMVTGSWNQSSQSGMVMENGIEFEWQLRNEAWTESPMRLVSVEVDYQAQGRPYSVRLNTLADPNAALPSSTTNAPASTVSQ